jgi:hypothetical protein
VIIVGCHLIMIDFQGPRGGVDLITIDDGELRHHWGTREFLDWLGHTTAVAFAVVPAGQG